MDNEHIHIPDPKSCKLNLELGGTATSEWIEFQFLCLKTDCLFIGRLGGSIKDFGKILSSRVLTPMTGLIAWKED